MENARMTAEETVSTCQLMRAVRCSSSSSGPLLRSLRETGASSSSGRPGRRSVPPNRLRSSGGGWPRLSAGGVPVGEDPDGGAEGGSVGTAGSLGQAHSVVQHAPGTGSIP